MKENSIQGKYYTNERNVQIVLSLLKAYGIRKVIASPGTTNVTLVASMQQDPFFEIYSCVDERSAAYMACGMCAESNEPVVLTCTGATASRNYYSGLTEAYYRKLPLIAITATQNQARVGHLVAQVIDRSTVANDVTLYSEYLPFVHTAEDEWECTIKMNKAMHALKRHGGGPVHINLETSYSRDFSVKQLPEVRIIKHFDRDDDFPPIPTGRIAVFVGNHRPMSSELSAAIDEFCAANNAAVFCDHTSNYKGKYRILYSLVGAQDDYSSTLCQIDLLIHIGEVSGAYDTIGKIRPGQVWRVNEDGEIRDPFKKLSAVFEMKEAFFFKHYAQGEAQSSDYVESLRKEYTNVLSQIGEMPFSNIWIAQTLSSKLPENSVLHLGILNTLRSWNYFEIPGTVTEFSNTGGFGIDGDISAMIGASLANPDKLYLGVVGDLAFFYDLNSMGNRHVGSNVRILLINNAKGVEFRNPYHPCYQFGEDADKYMAAAGHFGNQSSSLVKHYATDLGYEYLFAKDKESFLQNIGAFLTPSPLQRPIIFEVFTNTEDEKNALCLIHHIMSSKSDLMKREVKDCAKRILPDSVIKGIKKIVGKS